MRKPNWAAGKTKDTDPRIGKLADAARKFANTPEEKQRRAARLRRLYSERGDVMSPEVRAATVKKGSSAWTNKLRSMSDEERRLALKNFTTAGNATQKERRRIKLTPEQWKKKYPFGLGECHETVCELCGVNYYAWYGGRARPVKKLCSTECKRMYWRQYPVQRFTTANILYQSTKMNAEYRLHSYLEYEFALLLDGRNEVQNWSPCPFRIPYTLDGKRKYYTPDFFVNDVHVIELKSKWVRERSSKQWAEKQLAAIVHCSQHKLLFHYLEFDKATQYTNGAIANDPRFLGMFG